MYSKTAIILWHDGSKRLRTFESSNYLHDSRIRDMLRGDGASEHASGVAGIYIMDTPAPEVVTSVITVFVGQHSDNLYLSCNVDGQESNFWKLPSNMNYVTLLDVVLEIQKTGVLVGKATLDTDWRDGKNALTPVVIHDGNQLIFHLANMNDATKRDLRLVSA